MLAAAQGQAALAPRCSCACSTPCGRVPTSGYRTAPSVVAMPFDELTQRERDIVELIAQGLSNAEIAERLLVSTATVKTHVNHVFAKTGVRDRAQLVSRALRHERQDWDARCRVNR